MIGLDAGLLPALVLLSGATGALALWMPPAPTPWREPAPRLPAGLDPATFHRIAGSALGAILGLLLLWQLGLWAAPVGSLLVLAGYLAPAWLERLRRQQRRDRIEAQALPLAALLGSLADLPEANLFDALHLAAAETQDELSLLIADCLRSVGLGADLLERLREQALPQGGARLARLVGVLAEHLRDGEELPALLHDLEAEFQEARLFELREHAARADLRLTLVGMVCLVPALYLVSVVPAVLQTLEGLG